MNLTSSEHHPDDPNQLPPARRRRARRLLAPLNKDERADFLDELALRASPSFDFFLLSLVSGLALSLGLLLDTPAFLVLGAALAPLMAPAAGVSLGTVVGAGRLFMRSLVGLLIGCLIVFLAGWSAGKLGTAWLSSLNLLLAADPASVTHYLANLHAQISWPNFLVLAVSAVLTTAALARSDNPGGRYITAMPSAALAYELYIPLVAAGFGLGSGVPHLFPDGLAVFVLHLAWGALLGSLTLAVMGFRPLTLFGYTFGGALTLFGVILLIGLLGAGTVLGTGMGLPTPTPTLTPTHTPTPTITPTPAPPTLTPTPTITPSITPSPTLTLTPTPTPDYGLVSGGGSEGVRIRREPGGETIGFLPVDELVILLPETSQLDGVEWVRVRTSTGLEGWMVRALILQVTITPTPSL